MWKTVIGAVMILGGIVAIFFAATVGLFGPSFGFIRYIILLFLILTIIGGFVIVERK
jgi:hypothetical protein